ncbi:Nn.00g015870.m01.CDS01 [Neocucurbitaria sp. VM-36]
MDRFLTLHPHAALAEDLDPDAGRVADASCSPPTTIRSTSPSLSVATLPAPALAACALDLSSADYEAIRHFRTDFAKSHHVKRTDYSLISLMFNIAREEPMVLNMVIAIGLQEINLRRPLPEMNEQQRALQHYSSAIRQMADAISPNTGLKDLDAIYTALWMMILYEQQFGDSQCIGYIHHLKGVSSLLQHQTDSHLAITPCASDTPKTSVRSHRSSLSEATSNLSVYSARVLIWISLLDAAAASSGIGGHVNAAILGTLYQRNAESSIPITGPVQAFAGLLRYSGPLYRTVWGDAYPERELLDDIENRDVYALLAACVQLRFLTAQLAILYRKDPVGAAQRAIDVGTSISHVSETYDELIAVASKLSLETDDSNRIVSNIRAVVPIFHAVVLDFMRLTNFNELLGERQHYALKEIMNLVFQGHRHGGDEAMIKVAWPLFIAALETDDMLHRNWILERFKNISKYGRNFERAYDFLLKVIPMQQRLGQRIDVLEHLEKSAKFVLG